MTSSPGSGAQGPGADGPSPIPPGPDIPDPDFRPDDDGAPPLPDSELPEGAPEPQLPEDEEFLDPDVERARDVAGESEYDSLHTDQLLPESSSTEYDAPAAPSAAARQGVEPATEGRTETLDERIAQEEPEDEPPVSE